MDDLLQFVPEDRQEEFKTAAEGYTKLTDEVALDYVSKSQSLRDKIATPVVESYQKNFNEKKLPELVKAEKEKLMKELNPELTPEQKELREIREKLAAKEAKEASFERQASLRETYKDVAEVAAMLAPLEDSVVEKIVGSFQEKLAKIDELEKINKFGSKPPAGGGGGTQTDDERIKALRQTGNRDGFAKATITAALNKNKQGAE